jgi:hypothetical protein
MHRRSNITLPAETIRLIDRVAEHGEWSCLSVELNRVISESKRRGGEPPFMPWWAHTLGPPDIWDVVAFIRSLARKPVH